MNFLGLYLAIWVLFSLINLVIVIFDIREEFEHLGIVELYLNDIFTLLFIMLLGPISLAAHIIIICWNPRVLLFRDRQG